MTKKTRTKKKSKLRKANKAIKKKSSCYKSSNAKMITPMKVQLTNNRIKRKTLKKKVREQRNYSKICPCHYLPRKKRT